MSVLLTSGHEGTAGTLAGDSFYGLSAVDGGGAGQSQIGSLHAHSGSTSMRFDATDGYRSYTYTFAAATDQAAWRGYYYFGSLPAANATFVRFMTGADQYAGLRWTTAGKIQVQVGNVAEWTSTDSYEDTDIRVELRYNHSGGVIRCRIFAGANYETTTATEDSGALGIPALTAPTKAVWGWSTSGAPRYWLDDIALHDNVTAFIGPLGGSSPPSAAFTFTPAGGDTPLEVTFTDTSTGTPTSWSWDFGDGSAADTTQNPTHTYTVAGDYTIELTATNAGGSTTTTQTISVTTPTTTTVPVYVRIAGVMTLRTLAERQVRIAGVMTNITTINGVSDVVEPPPPPPPVGRFPGDPGVGKCYIGSNRPGDTTGLSTETQKVGWVKDKLTLQTTSLAGAGTRKPRLLRSYMGPGSAGIAVESSGYAWTHPERANNRMISRRLVQWAHEYGAIPWIEINVREIGMPSDSSTDAWMNALAAAYDKELGDASALNAAEQEAMDEVATIATHLTQYAPNPVWLSLDHEPEDNITAGQTARLTKFRKAQRAIVLGLRREGVDNVAIVACTFMTMTVRNQGGRDWRTWYPDWKGTSTGGATALNPFPNDSTADFWTADTRTGAINESVVDIVGHDIYFWDWEWKPTTSIDNANQFPTVAAASGWAADHVRAENLRIYEMLGKPWAIGEIGTQAAGYLGTDGKLIQRARDVTAMEDLGSDLGPYIEAGEIVGICYFNTYEHTWGRVDPAYSKALGMAYLHDAYNVVPPID